MKITYFTSHLVNILPIELYGSYLPRMRNIYLGSIVGWSGIDKT